MNKHLKQLIDLSRFDKAIDDFSVEESKINGTLNALFEEQKNSASAIEELEADIVDERNKIAKNETHLAELSAKLANHSKRGADLKSEKEIRAHQLEDEIAREQINFINGEIERLQQIEQSKSDLIEQKKARIAEIDGKIEAAKQANKEALNALDERRKSVALQKEQLVAEIPQKVFKFYEKIRRWAGDRTVVPVKKQACYGCFMKISDKVYGEVIASQEIVTCPNCGCILYIEESALPPQEAA
ncbi:MAG: C4-type zinc ribbon domain-containing protein [Helicobacteraceae bacterium]|jgi:predicted  nucleic acid-binding Zn-ribbon protein|nr:C4-type zinc ribbon domain-containing protein [Helicobacteraceae bacterium]